MIDTTRGLARLNDMKRYLTAAIVALYSLFLMPSFCVAGVLHYCCEHGHERGTQVHHELGGHGPCTHEADTHREGGHEGACGHGPRYVYERGSVD